MTTMDLNDYFRPISIEKPNHFFLNQANTVGRNITVHTPNNKIGDITPYHIAILGVPEERYSSNNGTSKAPDRIRGKLYQLYRLPKKLKLIDLGNLIPGNTPQDTYFGVADILFELMNNNVFPIMLGGSQDLTYGAYLASERMKRSMNLVTIDSRIDLSTNSEEFNSQTYLNKILTGNYLQDYTNIGHQIYFSDQEDLEYLKKLFFSVYRLGVVRSAMAEMEPILRDATMISLDICSIRQSDAPGHFSATPNGFYGEEMCQLSMYAGLSDRLSALGIFEVNPDFDQNDQTSHLAAQVLWYFIDGFANKKTEQPRDNTREFREYIVHLNEIDQDLVFYKSVKTNRWWIRTPVLEKQQGYPEFISCSYEDYQKASNQEIPDRWWKGYQKFN